MQIIKKHYRNFILTLQQQFVYMLIIGSLFSFIGWIFPKIYYQYIDQSLHYSLSQPVLVDKKVYKPCEQVTLSATRVSATDLVIDASNNLIKVDEKDPNIIMRVYSAPEIQNVVVEQSTGKPISFAVQLPCNISNGTYFWQGAIEYVVHDSHKTYVFKSELFPVEGASESGTIKNENPISL